MAMAAGAFPAKWKPVSRKKCSRPIIGAYSVRKTGVHFCGISACRWVQEQETSEQLDRLRRRSAASMHRRQLGKFEPPPREAFEGATDDRYYGPAIDVGIPSRARARPRPSRTEPGWPNHGVAVARLYG